MTNALMLGKKEVDCAYTCKILIIYATIFGVGLLFRYLMGSQRSSLSFTWSRMMLNSVIETSAFMTELMMVTAG